MANDYVSGLRHHYAIEEVVQRHALPQDGSTLHTVHSKSSKDYATSITAKNYILGLRHPIDQVVQRYALPQDGGTLHTAHSNNVQMITSLSCR